MCWRNAKTPNQTLLRPRAHRAVGRWPPASGAGRRVEKNVFPKIAGVKAPYPRKVKESRGKTGFRKTKIGWSLAESAVLGANRAMKITRRRFFGLLSGVAVLLKKKAWTYSTKNYSGPLSDHFDGTEFFDPDGVPPKSLRQVLRWHFRPR